MEEPAEDRSEAPLNAPEVSVAAQWGTCVRASSPLSSTPVGTARHSRSSSFQKWRRQMQRAWKWGPGGSTSWSREQGLRASVNVEAMANQKRQWYRIQSKARVNWSKIDHSRTKEVLKEGMWRLQKEECCLMENHDQVEPV